MKPVYFAVFPVPLFLIGLNCRSFAPQTFLCLPPAIRATDIVSAERAGDPPRVSTVTVGQKLLELKAECQDGTLVDGQGKEIRFYRAHCFGAPTAYALETMQQEQAELDTLRKKYTVIEMTCDPSGNPRP